MTLSSSRRRTKGKSSWEYQLQGETTSSTMTSVRTNALLRLWLDAGGGPGRNL